MRHVASVSLIRKRLLTVLFVNYKANYWLAGLLCTQVGRSQSAIILTYDLSQFFEK